MIQNRTEMAKVISAMPPRSLSSLVELMIDDPSTSSVSSLAAKRRTVLKSQALAQEGDQAEHLIVLKEGFAQADKVTAGGRSQTVALYTPGDILDAKALLLGWSSVSIRASTKVTALLLPRARIDLLLGGRPALQRALSEQVARDATRLEQWITNLGRLSALERTAHLLCEVHYRLNAAGRAVDGRCAFPFQQPDLADMLGLSVVHVNRVLQELRSSKLIDLRRGELSLLQPEKLKALACFDPRYLCVVGP